MNRGCKRKIKYFFLFVRNTNASFISLFFFLANNDVCGERDSTGNFELIATPVGKCIYFLFVSFAKLSITGFVFTSPLGSYVFGCQAKSLLARLHKGI